MTQDEIRGILDRVEYKDWRFYLGFDGDRPYLQVHFVAPDAMTGIRGVEHGRKWFLSRFMSKSEIVQTALKAVLTAEEHEARENFLYLGRRIFGPHIDVDALLEASERTDTRT